MVPPENFSSGVVLDASAGPKTSFAKIRNVIADLPALAATFGFKGHGGMKPCPFCSNVVNTGYLTDESKRIPYPSGMFVEISCFDPTKFITASENDLYAAVDTLSRARGNVHAEDFAACERAFGINFNPHGVLWCSTLRPSLSPLEMTSFDWALMYSMETMRTKSRTRAQHPPTYPHMRTHPNTLQMLILWAIASPQKLMKYHVAVSQCRVAQPSVDCEP